MPSMANPETCNTNHNDSALADGKRKNFELCNREKRQKIEKQRKALPIAEVEELLVERVKNDQTLIVVGETGSGKTTQLPQFLFGAGFCRDGKVIGITQPRRVAAVSVAKRVAEECGVKLGQKVGYSVRFDDNTSGSTRIKYMTDGILLREALLDQYLSKYSVIVVDEAHERTVHTDVLLGLLKKVQNLRLQSSSQHPKVENGALLEKGKTAPTGSTFNQRQGAKLPPLKLVIMSASLDALIFSNFFSGAKVIHVPGRQFPIYTYYSHNTHRDYVEAAKTAILQAITEFVIHSLSNLRRLLHKTPKTAEGYIKFLDPFVYHRNAVHLDEAPGDILVFLTGQDEIEDVETLVQDELKKLPAEHQKLLCIPIFSSLPPEQQMKVFVSAPDGFRKVILATNIAETSVTIPGIKYVIDPGLVKARAYNPQKGTESLIVIPTSKAQAKQRSGRAGREGPGKCFRLYPERIYEKKLRESTVAEIKRCNLSNVILQLKALGIDDISCFEFIEKPSRMAVLKSLEELFTLGALTEDGKLSDPVGQQMARFPLDPIYSKALILASQFNCLEEMLITVAMLSVESIFYAPRERLEESRAAMKRFKSPDGDHITLINVFRSFDEFLKSKTSSSQDKILKHLRKWCKENFINSRSLRHARDIHGQILRHVEQMGLKLSSCGEDMQPFLRCLAASFFMKVAERCEDKYRDKENGQEVQIHPSSALFRAKPIARTIVYNEMVRTNQNYVRNVSRIDPLWLLELAPNYYEAPNC